MNFKGIDLVMGMREKLTRNLSSETPFKFQ